MKYKIYKSILLGMSLLGGNAQAEDFYDHCNQVLVNGVLESYKIDHEFEKKIALKKWLCSNESSSGSASGGLEVDVIDIFTVDGSGGNSSSWKRENCSNSDYDYDGSASSHILIQKANETVINAWKECVLKNKPSNDKLVCLARESEGSLLIEVDFGYGIGDIKNIEVVGYGLEQITRTPTIIRPGKTNIRYKKKNPTREAYFDLNGDADYLSVACSYTIPPKPVIEESSECEDFRIESLKSGFLSRRDYEFLRSENQVPFFKQRRMAGYYPCSMYMNPYR